jgi:hypothetical protein
MSLPLSPYGCYYTCGKSVREGLGLWSRVTQSRQVRRTSRSSRCPAAGQRQGTAFCGDSEYDSWKVLAAVGRAADAMPVVGDKDCAHFVAALYAQ